MRVTVTSEYRFVQTPDGAVYTQGSSQYSFWTRYLSVFDSVQVVARVRNVERHEPDWVRADGAGVTFCPIPYYIGPRQFLARLPAIRKAIRAVPMDQDAVIMRVGSVIAEYAARLLRKMGHPFALEVVGDPYDVFSPGANRHPLRPFFRIWATASLKRMCLEAVAVAYVTKYALQRRYPSMSPMVGVSDVLVPSSEGLKPANVLATHYSSICLQQSDMLQAENRPVVQSGIRPASPSRLICVGTLQQLYKGQDILIRAVAACVKMGDDVVLRLVGDGATRPVLEKLADSLSIRGRCEFRGEANGLEAVVRELDEADVFVLPSRQEGLPRAMIEAMARGLPCIGTTVGGIPELLPPEDMVPPNDVPALARKIHDVTTSAERRSRMSAHSLKTAQEYTEETLRERRNEFYNFVKVKTTTWQACRIRLSA